MLNDSNLSDRIVIKTRNHAKHISLIAEGINAMTLATTGNEKCAMELQLAIVEALNNVFLHAYDSNPENDVTLIWQQKDQQLFIEIIDHGHSLSSLPEPELPDFMDENGRGWWIIKNSVDRYFYEVIEESYDDKSATTNAGSKESKRQKHNILTLVKSF